MVFAVGLVVEREPLTWQGLPAAFVHWVQDAGAIAAVGLVVYALACLIRRLAAPGRPVPLAWRVATGVAAVLVVLYGLFGVLLLSQGTGPQGYTAPQGVLLMAAGAVALGAVLLQPVLALVTRVRWRRVWALARLSILEAVRGRVLYVFALMALVFLFAGYFVPYKPEDQISNYVGVIFLSQTILFVVLAALLGSFSIPRDVVKQTIHTIVTKPVERYEIFLGRYLGNALLLTAGLAVLAGISLVYVARGVTSQAAEESYKARVPIEPDRLTFHGTAKENEGENVGREWDYRTFIRGRSVEFATLPPQYAIWWFQSVPAGLAEREGPVPVEFTFDIYRTSKADSGKEGVYCTLTFADGRLAARDVEERVRAAEREKAESGLSDEDLIRKYRVYKAPDQLVVNNHTGKLAVPALLFGVLGEAPAPEESAEPGEEAPPALKVWLSVSDLPSSRSNSRQLIGVAKRDLYLVRGELPFWQNFFKGTIGLWCLALLVLGVALACSTYLSGIISLICTFFLCAAGMMIDFLREQATGQAVGGGPVESAWRMANHLPVASSFDQSPLATLGRGIDSAFSLLLRCVLDIFPEVGRYDLERYVANGFDISWRLVLLDRVLPLAGYLLLWLVLAYYLMRSREIANPS
jgi:hypothetical protein